MNHKNYTIYNLKHEHRKYTSDTYDKNTSIFENYTYTHTFMYMHMYINNDNIKSESKIQNLFEDSHVTNLKTVLFNHYMS